MNKQASIISLYDLIEHEIYFAKKHQFLIIRI